MTMKILIKNQENKPMNDYFVHDDHEMDMYDFLKNHSNKKSMTTVKIDGANWFEIKLTSNDVEMIKETCWYSNTIGGNDSLDEELLQGNTIEVFIMEYLPKIGE